MSKIFKPRRGKASTMNGTKSSTVLAAGEMFIELPDTGVGTGICKMKMGDGVTAYSSLPYAMGGDIASTEITGSIVADTSDQAQSALANVTTGRTLGAIIGSLRRACELNANSIQKLNDDKVSKIQIQTGDASLSYTGNTETIKTVYFKKEFSSLPAVVAIPSEKPLRIFDFNIGAITTTYFEFIYKCSVSGNSGMQYIAILKNL